MIIRYGVEQVVDLSPTSHSSRRPRTHPGHRRDMEPAPPPRPHPPHKDRQARTRARRRKQSQRRQQKLRPRRESFSAGGEEVWSFTQRAHYRCRNPTTLAAQKNSLRGSRFYKAEADFTFTHQRMQKNGNSTCLQSARVRKPSPAGTPIDSLARSTETAIQVRPEEA